jgi:hypothetical protein
MVTRARFGHAWAWLLFGCGQVLGIHDAQLDPSLSEVQEGGAPSNHPAEDGGASSTGNQAGASSSSTSSSEAGSAGEQAAGAGGASGAAPGEGGANAGPLPLCERYCAAVNDGCGGSHTQYLSLEGCLAICALLPAGMPGDSSGNTVNCRLGYALKARSEPYTYCTWAGPGGDGKCGSNCDGFCTVMMQECTAASTPNGRDYFKDLASCMTTCNGLDDVGNYSATDSALQTGADHVQCRLYHVDAAVTEDDPTTHCPHATGQSLCHATTP